MGTNYACKHWAEKRLTKEGERLDVSAALAGYRILTDEQMGDLEHGISPKKRVEQATGWWPLDHEVFMCDECLAYYTEDGRVLNEQQRQARDEARRRAELGKLGPKGSHLARKLGAVIAEGSAEPIVNKEINSESAKHQ
jgi:hypothetical protein